MSALVRDAENSYLSGDAVDDDPMSQLCGHSNTYRNGVGPQAGARRNWFIRLTALIYMGDRGYPPYTYLGYKIAGDTGNQ